MRLVHRHTAIGAVVSVVSLSVAVALLGPGGGVRADSGSVTTVVRDAAAPAQVGTPDPAFRTRRDTRAAARPTIGADQSGQQRARSSALGKQSAEISSAVEAAKMKAAKAKAAKAKAAKEQAAKEQAAKAKAAKAKAAKEQAAKAKAAKEQAAKEQAAKEQAAKEQAAKAKADKAAADKRKVAALGYDPQVTDLHAIAGQMMATKYGWGAGEYSCFDKIIVSESGWNPHATNASSGAYGLPQALPGSKMASAGADWQTNPVTQIRWGLSYIRSSYGSPCSAWSFHLSHGWY